MRIELINLRKEILSVSYTNKAGHIPSAYSILEIVFSLYTRVLSTNDKFILSKGHGCLALYSVFEYCKFITKDQLYSFSQFESILGGHPDKNKLAQIEVSSGSLGHGLPISIGICLAKKIKKESGRVFCLVGDGECNEGTTWESLLLANKLGLNNLICIVDNNKSQVRSVPTDNLEDKFRSFGFNVIIINGHDNTQIEDSLLTDYDKPTVLICNTIKGFGIKEMEDDMFSWHHGPPNEKKYTDFLQELEGLSS